VSPGVGQGPLMVGRADEWFNSRRWLIRYLLYAEWVILVTFAALVAAMSL